MSDLEALAEAVGVLEPETHPLERFAGPILGAGLFLALQIGGFAA